MKRSRWMIGIVAAIVAIGSSAWAGGGGGPPGAGGGGGGTEPAIYALILFSIIPCYLLARRSLAVATHRKR